MKKRWRKRERRRWTPEQYRKGMYIIPSLFTVSNIFCGFSSISFAIRGNYEIAGVLIGIAMILDTLDGRLARMTNTASEFGVQLDSLADVITFGVAPAVLCYQWAFSNYEGPHAIQRAGWIVCFLYLICAASRLARFNVQSAAPHDKRYFVGMPTPAAAGVVAATVYCFPERIEGHPAAVVTLCVMALLAFLMISQIRYRTFKDLNLRQPRSFRTTVLIAFIIGAVAWNPKITLITLATLYAFSGMIGHLLGKKQKPTETTETAPPHTPSPSTSSTGQS
jgi:CDP-diacylglycerol--serine O-phosphatidyltransferase